MAPQHQDTIFAVVGKMSGRKLLGPSKAHLKMYIQEAEQLLLQSVNGKRMEEEEVVEDLVERINYNFAVVECCINDWASMLGTLKDEAKGGKK